MLALNLHKKRGVQKVFIKLISGQDFRVTPGAAVSVDIVSGMNFGRSWSLTDFF